MPAGFDAHHPHTGGGVEVEIHRPERFDAPGGQRLDGFRVGLVAGLVGAGLADHSPLLDGGEPGQRLGQRWVGLEGPLGLRQW